MRVAYLRNRCLLLLHLATRDGRLPRDDQVHHDWDPNAVDDAANSGECNKHVVQPFVARYAHIGEEVLLAKNAVGAVQHRRDSSN